jgi:GNAT superfamily N-acetyltransferase
MISERDGASRTIRQAVPAEAGTVAALHARARSTYCPEGVPDDGTDWAAAWRGVVERHDGQVLCVVEQGRIVAVASFRTPPDGAADTVKLFQFHVDPEHWRSGIGTALHGLRRTVARRRQTDRRPGRARPQRAGAGVLRTPGLGPGSGAPGGRGRSPPGPAVRGGRGAGRRTGPDTGRGASRGMKQAA